MSELSDEQRLQMWLDRNRDSYHLLQLASLLKHPAWREMNDLEWRYKYEKRGADYHAARAALIKRIENTTVREWQAYGMTIETIGYTVPRTTENVFDRPAQPLHTYQPQDGNSVNALLELVMLWVVVMSVILLFAELMKG